MEIVLAYSITQATYSEYLQNHGIKSKIIGTATFVTQVSNPVR
jgi:hypothetical protein